MKWNCKDRQFIFEKRYKKYEGREVAKAIIDIFEEQCPLSPYQKEWVERQCKEYDPPFQAYEWGNIPNRTSMFQRLCAPFVVLLLLLMYIIVCPIKWFLTGKFYFDKRDNKVTHIIYKWMLWSLGEK